MVRILEEVRGVKEGSQYGNWTVSGPAFSRGKCRWAVVAHCACGRVDVVRADHLANGDSTQCATCRGVNTHTLHGGAGGKHWKRERLYTIWHRMLQRCHKPNYPRYAEWGGRGIRVCDEWHSYPVFRSWAIANGYAENLSIDRYPNNSGNYESGNCRWATAKQQARNTRRNALLTYNGETLCVAEWAERIGVDQTTMWRRIANGWSVERIVTPNPKYVRSGKFRKSAG